MIRRTLLTALAALPVAATARPRGIAPGPGNREIVEDFVEIFYKQRDVGAAFVKHVAPAYVQHNPNIADGREAAIVALTPMFSDPAARFDVRHLLVDGDMAAVHLHAMPRPDSRGGAVVDLFRLANGKIVEHWDVLQAMPDHPANQHAMF
jgi:predicted SnoaL-like aldol condensation-catalyzing enzyme